MKVTRRMRRRGELGFTLVELMVVVAVIAILSAMSTPTLTRSMRRGAAKDSANNIAQVLRTARTQAMSRGEIVLLRFDASSPNTFVTMSAAPNTVVGDLTSPVMRSCRLLTSFADALNNPRADATNTPIVPETFSLENVLDPDMSILDVGVGNVRDLCFSPDGRVFDSTTATARPVDYPFCGGDVTRGFVMAVGRNPGGNARNLNNPLGGTIDTICTPFGRETEVSVALDAAYAHVIEVTYNGAVTVE